MAEMFNVMFSAYGAPQTCSFEFKGKAIAFADDLADADHGPVHVTNEFRTDENQRPELVYDTSGEGDFPRCDDRSNKSGRIPCKRPQGHSGPHEAFGGEITWDDTDDT